MNDQLFQELWSDYGRKLDHSLTLARQNAEAVTQMKVQSVLKQMKPMKLIAIGLGIAWVGFVDLLIIRTFTQASLFFLVSALIQVLLTKVAIGIYLYQLIVIEQINLGLTVVETQEKIASLKASTLWVTRLLCLQLPVWTTFYLHEGLLEPGIWLAIQLLFTALSGWLAIWLFFNINHQNRNKRWFKWLFDGPEWSPLLKSIEMLDEIEQFKYEGR